MRSWYSMRQLRYDLVSNGVGAYSKRFHQGEKDDTLPRLWERDWPPNTKEKRMKRMKQLETAAPAPTETAIPEDLDLVILNGRVMDPETKLDAVRNVGVKDGKIVTITEQAIKGSETIDAKGHVVAPGFIDTHWHALDPFGRKIGLRDGVTTGMDIEAGAINVAKWYAVHEG